MPVLKLQNFGGMIPAVDARLLPENQAQTAENAWVYSGAIEGFREPVAVHTLSSPLIRRVYRVPVEYYDKDHIPDSYWLEFENTDVDVISSPVVGDQFKRFYWAFSQSAGGGIPQYTTKARIASGSPAYTLGIPRPSAAPKVTRVSGQFWLDALTGDVKVTGGGNSHLYNGKAYAQDPNSFQAGGARATNPSQYGATSAVSSQRGNMDKSSDPALSQTARNQYKTTGQRAELRYGTVQAGIRITISDTGQVSVGVPNVAADSTNPYEGLGVQESRAYVYTWVSAFGEEGPPSPPTLYDGWSGDPWIVQVTAPTTPDLTNRDLSKVRIYRTVTGVGGSTTYFFVAELDISQTVYTDTLPSTTVASGNLLESVFYEAPPADLEGMVAMPNGIIAGWRDNEIWFSEPFLPHAWPSPYTIATEYPIVGMGVIGQTLIVCTTGSPYAVSGVNPATMTMSRIAVNEPCLSRASIISTPQGVAYASPNGVAMAVPGAVSVVTRNIITKDLWLDPGDFLSVPSLRAALLNGNYYAWGSVLPGGFQTDAFQTDAFVQEDFTGSYHGAFVDISNPRVSWVNLRSEVPTYNCFADQWTGEVFVIRDGKVYWLDLAKNRARQSYVWRSKIFETPNRRNFEAMRVWFNDTGGESVVRVYADNVLRFTRPMLTSGEFMRLPSGFKAQLWEVEIEGSHNVTMIEMATAAKELGLA